MVVGFTGTRNGMTSAQYAKVEELVGETLDNVSESIDGCCIGSDAQFFDIVNSLGITTRGYPGYSKMAGKENLTFRDIRPRDFMEEPDTYLSRNRSIVDDSDVMIATPKGQNFTVNGGTNYTINYAIKSNKEIYIVLPNGDVIKEI